MNTQGNFYTFIYASVLVVIVAAILSFIAIKLQPIQDKNIRIEKIQNILASVNIESTVDNAEKLYDEYISESYVLNTKGEIVEGVKAFDVNLNPQVKSMFEIKKLTGNLKNADATTQEEIKGKIAEIESSRLLPVFVCLKDGNKYNIIPVRGKGLWGPIWGYVSLKMDYNTIYGVVFAHKGETPGLGADIDKEWFQDPFKGKTIFDNNKNFTSIIVYKGGKGSAEAAGDIEHGVDAISGGTITSNGLEAMLMDCLESYVPFFKSRQEVSMNEPAIMPADSLELPVDSINVEN